MNFFKKDDHIEVGDSIIKIVDFVSDGTQGQVYRAIDLETNETKAFKYLFGNYCNDSDKKIFHERTKLLGTAVPPHDAFVFPEKIGELHKNLCFGYTMEFVKGYKSVGGVIKFPDTLTKKQKYLLSLRITEAFHALANEGYLYTDVSAGNILYKLLPRGDISVKIIDCENVTIEELTLGLSGTELFRAPEIISKGSPPTMQSMYHAISVLIYRILMGGSHPLAGSRCDNILITPETTIEIYGKNPIFPFHYPKYNQPYKSALKEWKETNKILQCYFQYQFSNDCLKQYAPRFDLTYLIEGLKEELE